MRKDSVPTAPRSLALFVLAACLAALYSPPALAQDFPPISPEEQELNAVPWSPGAHAVVLRKHAELRFMDYPREVSSFLEVHVRIKILDREGLQHGEVSLPHSRHFRLKSFRGRTALADGRTLPVAEEDLFRQQISAREGLFVTKAAFPALEPGAIVDYRYTLRWDSLFFLEPFVFSDVLPVLHAQIVYDKPDSVGLTPWGVEIGGKFDISSDKGPRGQRFRVAIERLPAVPPEPLSFPAIDLSSRFMMVPQQLAFQGQTLPLLDSWKSVVELMQNEVYGRPAGNDRKAKRRARELIADVTTPDERAKAIYRHVRDEIRTQPAWSVFEVRDGGPDAVLDTTEGSEAEKALLLRAMLSAAKLRTDLVWAADRSDGRTDLSVPNPHWFERVLVALELDGQTYYLDPSDRRLGFGHLSADNEGMQAIRVHRKRPEVLELPGTGFTGNRRHATLKLEVNSEGRAAGQGKLLLEGLQAWSSFEPELSEEELNEHWQAWLEERLAGCDITEVESTQDRDSRRIEVTWHLQQRDEEVLGDELSWWPSQPLGPTVQPFPLDADQRRTPVLLAFPRRDELELTLTWPQGWELDAQPQAFQHQNEVGAAAIETEVDLEQRQIRFHRRLDLYRKEIVGSKNYTALRELYAAAETHDAHALVLLRP